MTDMVGLSTSLRIFTIILRDLIEANVKQVPLSELILMNFLSMILIFTIKSMFRVV